MFMPKLSRGATRVAPIGRSSSGLRLSGPGYTAYCRCTCTDGTSQCASGTGNTEQTAKDNAHHNAGNLCAPHGGVQAGSSTYVSSC